MTVVLAASLTGLSPAFASAAEQVWSPDGKWLAILTQTGTVRSVPVGWWARTADPFEAKSTAGDPVQFQIWVCQRETRRCWPIASNETGLSMPAWSPDGRDLAYVRLEERPDRRVRCSFLLQHGFEPPRELASCALGDRLGDAQGLSGRLTRLRLASASSAPVWSPKGNYLAVPWFEPEGVAILRVADGVVVAKYADATSPSWSPDERRLALVLPAEPAGYHVTAPNFGPTLPAIASRFANQPAVWEPGNGAFHAIVWRDVATNVAMPPNIADLVRFDVGRGRPETVRQVLTKRPAPNGEPANLAFDRIPETGTLFVVTAGEGHSTEAIELDLSRQSGVRRHTILDRELVVGSPSVAPDRQTVAVRIGSADSLGVHALYDLRTTDVRLILPNAAAQLRAAQAIMAVLGDATETLLRPVDGKPAWFVRLPSPRVFEAAFARDPRYGERITRLATFGRAALDAEWPDQAEPEPHRALLEAAMFLNFMAGDYVAALDAAQLLEPHLQTSHDRLALAVVRTQCCLGARKNNEARKLLTLLRPKVAPGAGNAAPRLSKDEQSLATEAWLLWQSVKHPRAASATEHSFFATVERLLEESSEAEK
jgi:hypothetical protein